MNRIRVELSARPDLVEATCPDPSARAILESAPIGLALFGRDECYRFASARLEARRGPGLVGRSLRDVLGPVAYAQARPHVEAVLEGRSVAFELPMPVVGPGPEATYLWLEPVRASTGAVVGFVSQELDQADLERAGPRGPSARTMDAVARLAGGLVHDFHNLAQAILGGARMILRRSAGDEEQRRPAEQLCETAMRATQLSAQLLAFAGKQTMNPGVVDLNESLRQRRCLLERAAGPGVSVELELDPTLERSWRVWIDPVQFERIILNLVINARDAMPSGGHLTLTTRAPDDDAPSAEHYITLLVRDEGQGMDAATLATAFEPFFTTKAAGFATGLGLSTVYGIVHASGGVIRADSEPARGTTFELLLPARRTETAARTAPALAPARVTVLDGAVTPTSSGPAVLVLEDNACTRLAITALLRDAGYRVIPAASASHADRLYDDASDGALPDVTVPELAVPEVAIIDLGLPGERGCAFATRLRARFPEVRVIFISGDPDQAGVATPADAFLAKPFELDELARIVRDLSPV